MAERKARIELNKSQVDQWLRDFKDRIANAGEYLKAVYATIGFRDIMDHFDREEGPSGKWRRRSPATQRRYARIAAGELATDPGVARSAYNPSNKLLQLTGDMRKSILPGNADIKTQTSILVFANDPKSGRHDRGEEAIVGPSGAGRIPKRPFMWLSNETKKEMAKALTRMMRP